MLYDETDHEAAAAKRASILAKAERSDAANRKQTTRGTVDGLPVHSFQTSSIFARTASLRRTESGSAYTSEKKRVRFQSFCDRSVRLLAAAFLLAALHGVAAAQPIGAIGNWGGPDFPIVTAVAPTNGTTLGGTAVTITGGNLAGAAAVTFGGAVATGVMVVSATSIVAVTPAHAVGVVDVVVTTPGGTGTGSGLYTYVAPPTVTSIAPTSGTTLGGTSVMITGTNFTGATAVTLGGTAATAVELVNATTITAVTPAHAAGIVDVVVTTAAGTGTGSGLYTYVAPPTVMSIAPTSGTAQGGTSVTIIGTNFAGSTAVTFGGTAATGVAVVNATTITAVTPAHAAGMVDVVVTTLAGTGTGSRLYTYVAPPTVISIAPTSGPTQGGTAVTLTGTNLIGATKLTLGGTAATGVTVVNAATITAVTPAHAAGVVNVAVTTAGGTVTGSGLYTYVAPPTVTSIAPTTGTTLGGTSVTLTGTNFTGATALTFGGTAATGVTVVNATTITAMTPAHAAGTVELVVTTPGGTARGVRAQVS
jgi:hypothetical protein